VPKLGAGGNYDWSSSSFFRKDPHFLPWNALPIRAAKLNNLGAIKKPGNRTKIKRDLTGTYFAFLTAILLINLYLAYYNFVLSPPTNANFSAFFATANILIAVLVRNEIFLNVLYRVLVKACRPLHVPVAVKNSVTLGLLHIGGIHAGCATASLIWLAVGLFHLLSESSANKYWAFLSLSVSIIILLAAMCIMALPMIRDRNHDLFEYIHRFFGWSALLMLWADVLLTISLLPQTVEAGLLLSAIRSMNFWLTALITALILSPWLTVRKVRVQAQVSSQAVIEVTFPGVSAPGMFGRISRHALADWHAFALVSGEQRAVSHMMVISGVGDFTKGLIATPPAALYVRKIKFPGLPYCVPMYRRSIIIATGAGMAPYLSLLLVLPHGSHQLIWIGRSFREYFGNDLCDLVFRWPDLVLVDTTNGGRPDMTALAVDSYRSFRADAVFVGSNPEGTRQIVSGCRALGIPAFGPSWDS
jgi:hypothetical protein